MTAELRNIEIFSAEKQIQLQQAMKKLLPVWKNVSDEVMPFACRKKSQKVTVSVIIPVYNVEKFLTKALQSIVNQTLPDIEIICVDDGSTDRSLDILKFFAAHDERITVITQPKSNAAAARNTGIHHISGEYLYIMDSDDWCVPHMLETAVKTLEKNSCDMVAWSYQAIDSGTEDILYQKKLNDGILDVHSVKNLFPYLSPCPWNKLFRSDMIRQYNLHFQEITNNNDSSFTMCAIALANKIWTIAEPLYFYRKSGTGLQASLTHDPYCCIQARIHSKNEMIRLGVMIPPYEKHFVDAFYHMLGLQLQHLPLTLEQLIEIRNMLREHFDYRDIKITDVIDKEAYVFIQSMFFSDDEFYPTKLITSFKQKQGEISRIKKENAVLKENNSSLNKEIATLKKQLQKLKKSHSYRLGRLLTWLPRKLLGK